ncbi:hypothetical protein XH83_18240 [Bradyrhizobium sp. CCBAU 53351]|uniref:hypothetical protein n=1 Tax=Bradyrhizobium sp. CCBAU 53351 TaxID=1325114 RepID=UPI00188915DA|nr:hypothetical protein [Bradyrhizobium sp. CCBAU 53351]QOZ77219.1 hypothetical protein XH83_18240 [Bradyrhizobium sp. CCBAU 53351]
MESDAEQAAPVGSDAAARLRTGQREVSHSSLGVYSVRGEARESEMDECWFLAEIAKVFWYDRHPRTRKARPSVPQVPPTSADAASSDATFPETISPDTTSPDTP